MIKEPCTFLHECVTFQENFVAISLLMIKHCFPRRLFNDVFSTEPIQRLIVMGLQTLHQNGCSRRQMADRGVIMNWKGFGRKRQ
jgi:hypothetical protein